MDHKNIKIIYRETINNMEYRLMYWANDNVYVICGVDKNIKGIASYPEVFQSNKKDEVIRFFQELGLTEGKLTYLAEKLNM